MKEYDMPGAPWLPDYRKIVACQEMEREPASEAESPVSLPPEILAKEERIYWKDYEYITRLLPSAARECWAAADAILDRYEFEDSAIYMEYPDQVTLQRIADMVYDTMRYSEAAFRELAYTMTLWNISYRRQRYYRRQKVFYGTITETNQ